MGKTEMGPDFLGIGAQKAGTTWLWTQLSKHPGVWMPPRKEVHFFDRNFPEPNYLGEPKIWNRLFGNGEHHRIWRAMMKADFQAAFRKRDWKALLWNRHFYFGACDDAWYCDMFRAAEGRTCGEITPAYSILPEENVAHITRLLPSLKVILLLRNPVERAWSQVRFDWTRGARSDLANLGDIKKFIDSPAQELRSSYLRMLDVWERRVPRERFFFGFYDEISTRPEALLKRVHEFLGVEARPSSAEDLSEKVHASREAAMPAEIHQYLAAKYLPELTALEQRFGGLVTGWLEAARAAAEKPAVAGQN